MNTPTTLDTYEALCDYAREYSEHLDNLRWTLGDIANTVMSRYSEKTIEDFARDIGQRKSTIYQYAKVASFYPPSLRRRLTEDMPNLNYSHLRDGLRLGDIEKAVTWLNEVSREGWSADKASYELTERLGKEIHTTTIAVVEDFEEFEGADYMMHYRYTIKVLTDDRRWNKGQFLKIKDN